MTERVIVRTPGGPSRDAATRKAGMRVGHKWSNPLAALPRKVHSWSERSDAMTAGP